jgi:hypothetical protein
LDVVEQFNAQLVGLINSSELPESIVIICLHNALLQAELRRHVAVLQKPEPGGEDIGNESGTVVGNGEKEASGGGEPTDQPKPASSTECIQQSKPSSNEQSQ